MASIAELKEICQKKKEVSWFSQHLYRPVSILITSLIVRTSISANSVSIAGILIWLAGALLLISQRTFSQIACVVCLQLGTLLDHVDGEVARYRKRGGYGGRYLDYLGHLVLGPALFMCLAISVFQCLHYPIVLYLGILIALANTSCSLSSKEHILIDLIRTGKVNPNSKSMRKIMADNPSLASNGGSIVRRFIAYAERIIVPIREIVRFPSYIIVISLAIILDLVIPPLKMLGIVMNFRFLALLLNILFVFNLPRRIYKDFALSEEIQNKSSSSVADGEKGTSESRCQQAMLIWVHT